VEKIHQIYSQQTQISQSTTTRQQFEQNRRSEELLPNLRVEKRRPSKLTRRQL
jgi:hypothetical protein